MRDDAVALFIPDILNLYFTEIVRGLQDEARTAGYLTLLFDTGEDPQHEHEFLRMLAGQRVCGIISCGSRLPVESLAGIRTYLTTPMAVINL